MKEWVFYFKSGVSRIVKVALENADLMDALSIGSTITGECDSRFILIRPDAVEFAEEYVSEDVPF